LKDYIDLKKFIPASLDGRILSIIVFSLFFSWLLAFPFEGQVLYAISARHNITPHAMLFGSIAAHFLGLISSGFVVKSLKTRNRTNLFPISSIIFIQQSAPLKVSPLCYDSNGQIIPVKVGQTVCCPNIDSKARPAVNSDERTLGPNCATPCEGEGGKQPSDRTSRAHL
jgi:hypothetical protein